MKLFELFVSTLVAVMKNKWTTVSVIFFTLLLIVLFSRSFLSWVFVALPSRPQGPATPQTAGG